MNHCIDTQNEAKINGNGSISVFFNRKTCNSIQQGAAKNITVTKQHNKPKKKQKTKENFRISK